MSVKYAKAPHAKTCAYCHKGCASHRDTIEEQPRGQPKVLYHARCYTKIRKARRRALRAFDLRPTSEAPLVVAEVRPSPVSFASPVMRADFDTLLTMLAEADRRLTAVEAAIRNGPAPAAAAVPDLTEKGTPRQRRTLRPWGALNKALLALVKDGHPRTSAQMAAALASQGVLATTNAIASTLIMGRAFQGHVRIVSAGRGRNGSTYQWMAHATKAELMDRVLALIPAEPFFAADILPKLPGVSMQTLHLRLGNDPRFEVLGHGLYARKDVPDAN